MPCSVDRAEVLQAYDRGAKDGKSNAALETVRLKSQIKEQQSEIRRLKLLIYQLMNGEES